MTVSETSVAATVNLLSTPACILLLPLWMMAGSAIFGFTARCKTSEILKELCVFLVNPSNPF